MSVVKLCLIPYLLVVDQKLRSGIVVDQKLRSGRLANNLKLKLATEEASAAAAAVAAAYQKTQLEAEKAAAAVRQEEATLRKKNAKEAAAAAARTATPVAANKKPKNKTHSDTVSHKSQNDSEVDQDTPSSFTENSNFFDNGVDDDTGEHCDRYILGMCTLWFT